MKAVVCDQYGPPDVLRITDVPRPVPRPDEVLIKIRATTVNRSDCAFRAGIPRPYARLFTGLRRPRYRILGSELSGEVEAIGPAVTRFEPGDAVFGVRAWKFGAHAEYVCLREGAALAHKPAGASFEEAAAVCDGVILALMGLRRADLRKGRSILIYGASGSIGTAAVQLSRYHGADVTAVCTTKNLELMRSLGADHVIDYTRDDFTASGQAYDVIFDAVGKHSFARSKDSLSPGGIYLATDHLFNLVRALWT
ncbi:MAG TPA: NAD(P)-dependent alcohol dehydrogenase, partial [Novosphingobium sp.]|nr:NAD(P)-dependent alcohol dehydrogenase [Novosphingobium sp.]